jgi:ribose 5-phosphate isomerase B
MKIAIASDHAGYAYKKQLIADIREQGYQVLDLGTNSETPTDYPDQAADIVHAIQGGKAERGVVICGSGVGVCVAANKFRNIRAGVCHDVYSAHQCVEHDDANVLCIGQRVIGIELAREVVKYFLKAKFTGEERHKRRLEKVLAIEKTNMKEDNE